MDNLPRAPIIVIEPAPTPDIFIDMQNSSLHEHWRRAVLGSLGLLLFAGCGSSARAPIRDQGMEFPAPAPEIVGNSGPIEFQPVIDPDSPAPPGIHRVREGDTLYAIAFMYGVDYRELSAANGLTPPYTIYVDQELRLGGDAGGEPSGAAVIPAAPIRGIERRPIGNPVNSAAAGLDWQWPLAGPGAADYRPDINNRLDIEGEAGERVRAARGGEVVYARPFGDEEGTLLIIRHDDRYLSAYTQTGRVLVDTGERVAAGQPIVELAAAESGPPMLYFNVQRDGAFVDPTSLLP